MHITFGQTWLDGLSKVREISELVTDLTERRRHSHAAGRAHQIRSSRV